MGIVPTGGEVVVNTTGINVGGVPDVHAHRVRPRGQALRRRDVLDDHLGARVYGRQRFEGGPELRGLLRRRRSGAVVRSGALVGHVRRVGRM